MEDKFKVQIRDYTFYITLFCYKKVGETENMKLRLECEQDCKFNGEYDDYESVKEVLVEFMRKELFDYMIMTV